MKNVLFVSSEINLKGAPKTRVEGFAKVFLSQNNDVVRGGDKLLKSSIFKRYNLVYVESSTNRLSLADIISLVILRVRSKCIIVFIRDVYIEYFPENYRGVRKRITSIANRISYFFLAFISNYLVFPTIDMGDFFYKVNTHMPKRKYFDLPPATIEKSFRVEPNFNDKIGILYLGAVSYKNTGFEHFVTMYRQNADRYNFFVLTNDNKVYNYIEKDDSGITIDYVKRDMLKKYLSNNNILFAIHSRPRNDYDDMTFPIKVLDFISLGLPFVSEMHKPVVNMIGSDYPLYANVNNELNLSAVIEPFCNYNGYIELLNYLGQVSLKNTYKQRYDRLEAICKQDF